MEERKDGWYLNMVSRFKKLAEELKLEEEMATELMEFMFDIAKEQYKNGNKAGILFAMSDEGKKYFNAKE